MALQIEDIETERLRLTALSFKHSRPMFSLWSHPDVCRFSGTVTDYDRVEIPMPAASSEDSDRIIDFWQRAAVDGWGFRWAILERSSGHMVGHIGFNSIGPTFEIAYHLHPDHWGKGIMLDAAQAAIGWARRSHPGAELDAFIEPDNQGSIRLASRLNFVPTDEFSDGAQRYRLAADART